MVYVGERPKLDLERCKVPEVAYCGGDSARGELKVLGVLDSEADDLIVGKVSITRDPGTEPGGRFPGNSMETIHVRG